MHTRPPGLSEGTRTTYTYDAHGSMTSMPHLSVMEWNFKDQLQITQQQIVNPGLGERTYYVYDVTGQRVRKVTDRPDGKPKDERIYSVASKSTVSTTAQP